MDDGKKICTFIGFSKMFLFDVKVEILLISSHFLMFSWIRPPTCPFTATLIFVQM